MTVSDNESPETELQSQTVLAGKYRLEYPAGRGGMGEVWRATHVELRKPVAIKFLSKGRSSRPALVQQFIREGRALAALHGNDIVEVFDVGDHDGLAFMIMEWLQGETVAKRLDRGAMNIEEVARVLGRVLRALSHVHKLGIIHRDVKPDNIHLGEGGSHVVKLIDFGMAADVLRDPATAIAPLLRIEGEELFKTRTGAFFGTPIYMSPELFLGRQPDHFVDLWSVAITAYQCILNQLPFHSKTLSSLMTEVITDERAVPSEHGRVPPGFDEWFARATHRDVNRRFQSADAMARALFAIVGRAWNLEGGYQPYPTELVLELEQLTKDREYSRDALTPAQEETRQKRIDQLVVQLKRTPVSGDLVANAKLVRIVGKGNYGCVWEALERDTGRTVAVKVFDSDRLGLGGHLYHFRRGVRAMQRLRDASGRPESIIHLHDVEDSALAFSMSYLNGGDLTKVSARGWSFEKKLQVFETICEAVAFAHKHDVLHRDIKPANIVMHEGRPILTDFDTADLLFVKTLSTHSMGSFAYAAPEQLSKNARRDPSGDIFSLGRLLHFLILEDDPPIRYEDVPRLRDLDGLVSDQVIEVIRHCTLHDPAARYRTIDLLLRDLRRCERRPEVGRRDTKRAGSAIPAPRTDGTSTPSEPGGHRTSVSDGINLATVGQAGGVNVGQANTVIVGAPAPPPASTSASKASSWGKRAKVVAGVITVVGGAAFAVWKLWHPGEEAKASQPIINNITNNTQGAIVAPLPAVARPETPRSPSSATRKP